MLDAPKTRLSVALRRAIRQSGLPHYRIAQAVGLDPDRFSQLYRGWVCDYGDVRVLKVAALVGVPKDQAFLLDEAPIDDLPQAAPNGRPDLRRYRRGPALDVDGAGGAFFWHSPAVWRDPTFLELGHGDRLVALYLLTATVGATVSVQDLATAIGVDVPDARAALTRVFDRFDWAGIAILDPDAGLARDPDLASPAPADAGARP